MDRIEYAIQSARKQKDSLEERDSQWDLEEKENIKLKIQKLKSNKKALQLAKNQRIKEILENIILI